MRIGIDLGGTKTAIVLLDQNGTIRLQKRVPTPQGDYAKTLATLVELVTMLEAEVGVQHPLPVGVGIPGALSPTTGRIQHANSVCLTGHDLAADLTRALHRPIRLANDADCFALSEATDGAGAAAPTLFGVILGTGVGGGIVINRTILSGPNAIAGEWGHNPLPWSQPDEQPGPLCYCGQRGCIETFLCGPALAMEYFHQTGHKRTPPEIEWLAQQGDQQAEALLTHYENRLARALASVINILDPHVIVLGGGLSNMQRLYRTVPALWNRWIFSNPQPVTRLLQARFGDASGVRGAAWLWPAD